MKKIQVGFLLSYDYEKLKKSIPPVYKSADSIFIAEDIEYRTWSGQTFTVDPSFYTWLEEFDTENKIEIYKDDFYDPNLSAIKNDNRERRMLSERMGIGNWLVQVDSDEYFLDFEKYVANLREYDHFLDSPEKNKIQIAAFLINMYKYVDGGVLFVKEPTRGIMATNYPNYRVARQTRQRIVYTPNILLHECLARTEEEIKMKFDNWGHNVDIPDRNAFMEKWRRVDSTNYGSMRNFFYIEPEKWKELSFVMGEDLNSIRKNLNLEEILPSNSFIWKKNFGQYFKHLFKK